jgi:ubiquinone/menaquinone biosynthesis C-methylase UbiE
MHDAQTDDYEYRGLLAATWDVWRDDTANWADRLLFLDVIRRYGQPALDVGCATGRLILDFLAHGIDCDGVDISPEMLDITRAKASELGLSPNLYQQPMEALDLPCTYLTILVPSSSFQLLVDETVAREALRRFHQHLQPGGALIMPFFLAWTSDQPLESEWSMIFEKARASEGVTIRRWGNERYDIQAQLFHTKDRFEIEREGQIVYTEDHARSPAGRWYSQAQAVALYEAAGFVNIRVTSEFADTPATDSDTLFCVLGEKPQ